MAEALFDRVARFYDYEQANFIKDIPFYTDYARSCGGEVLELGCGSGRILIPIAEAGIKITGLDVSPAMLNIAQKKIDPLDKNIQRNIHLRLGSMEKFEIKNKFSMIFIAFRSFQHLVEREERDSCLDCVSKHLDKTGIFILDLFAPRHDYLAQQKRSVFLGGFYDQENGVYVTRRAEDEYDLREQTIKEDRFYEWTGEDGAFHRHLWTFKLYYLFRYEVELLLEKHGFKIIDVYGDFDKSPYNYYSGEQIFVAQK